MAIENLLKKDLLLEVLFSNFVIFGYVIEAGQPKRKKKEKGLLMMQLEFLHL
jgi:hypothetical protein